MWYVSNSTCIANYPAVTVFEQTHGLDTGWLIIASYILAFLLSVMIPTPLLNSKL